MSLSDFTTLISCFRLIYLAQALLLLKGGSSFSLLFDLKLALKRYPFAVLVSLITVSTFLLAVFTRVFEHMREDENLNLYNYMWL